MPTSRLLQHLRNYASAGLITALAGLISFPLMTRNLSVADYGIVGLITSSITLFIAFGKLGVQHAVIRYFSQIKNGNIAFSSMQLHSTVTAMFLMLASCASLLFLVLGFQVLPVLLQYEDIASLFPLATAIVFIRILGSGVINFLRAEQRSADVAVGQGLTRCLNLALLIAVVLIAVLDPHAVLVCLLLAELTGVCYVVWQYRSELYFNLADISSDLGRGMLVYGLPLMILESLGLVLRLSDRYIIEAMLGVNELGQYSASYNLTAYLDLIILATLLQAIRPAYMQIWESQSKEHTRRFLARGLHIYVVVGIPFITMFSVTSPYLLSLLAGPRYAPGTVIIPWVAISFWLEGAMIFLTAGLYIAKNTSVLMYCSLLATLTNLGLNVLLIPQFGLIGAAVVTVFSYAVFIAAATFLSFRHISFKIGWLVPAAATVASLLVYFVFRHLNFGNDLSNFLGKGVLGTATLLIVIWCLDRPFRQWITELTSS